MSSDRAVTIDWLSYTLPWKSPRIKSLSPEVTIELVAERASGMVERWYAEKPLHGYRWQVVSVEKPGLRVMISPRNHDMGVHVQFAGSALAGENVIDRLDYALNYGGNVTRIDLAVDVAQAWDIPALYQLAKDGGAKTRTKKFSLITSTEGTTFYAGSRTSEKFLRIYDKAAQTGSARPWTRIELECKGDFAANIAKFVAVEGLHQIPAVIRGYFDFEGVPVWNYAMDGHIDKVSLPKVERQSNTRGWLLEQVAPALAKYLEHEPEFLQQFITRVECLLPSNALDIRGGKAG